MHSLGFDLAMHVEHPVGFVDRSGRLEVFYVATLGVALVGKAWTGSILGAELEDAGGTVGRNTRRS